MAVSTNDFAETATGKKCALDRIRTYGLLLRRQPLYPLSYEGKATVAANGNVKELSRCRGCNVKPGEARTTMTW